MDKHYDKKYHAEMFHSYLYSYPEYYRLKAKVAYLKYFKNIKGIQDKKILDFGTGLGQSVYYLNKLGFDVKGYDISKFALKFCREKGLDVTDNLSKLGKFDVIFSSNVLEHLANPLKSLVEIKKKLNKDGILILVLPYERHRYCSLKPSVDRHLYCWNFNTINNLLDEAGYKVIENKIVNFELGYKQLMFISRVSFPLFYCLVKLIGRWKHSRELKIVAMKK
jgi:SAM-dependent methyltransferase